MARRLWARESAGLKLGVQLTDSADRPVDITGWTLACSFARQRGVNLLTLGMAASAAAQGFWPIAPAEGRYQVTILPASLQAIPDETGDFTMFGDVIATLPGGERLWIEDWELQVTEGPTA